MSTNKRPNNKQNMRKLPGSSSPGGAKVQIVKVVLLGDQGVGKSSIAFRFVRGEFMENSEATIGAAYLTQTATVTNESIKFDIWDTAGQERYNSLAPLYYRGAQAAIVVYDITNSRTFSKAMNWVKELKNQASSQMVVALVGNKADMTDQRAVSREDAGAFAAENKLIFTESSAKTGLCVGEIFMGVAQLLARRGIPADKPEAKGLKLGTNSNDRKRECHC